MVTDVGGLDDQYTARCAHALAPCDPAITAALLFVGLTELRRRIAMSAHESLDQRIVMRFHLGGLACEEFDGYLEHRLQAAGCELPLFEPAATEAIFQATRRPCIVIARPMSRRTGATMLRSATR